MRKQRSMLGPGGRVRGWPGIRPLALDFPSYTNGAPDWNVLALVEEDGGEGTGVRVCGKLEGTVVSVPELEEWSPLQGLQVPPGWVDGEPAGL